METRETAYRSGKDGFLVAVEADDQGWLREVQARASTLAVARHYATQATPQPH